VRVTSLPLKRLPRQLICGKHPAGELSLGVTGIRIPDAAGAKRHENEAHGVNLGHRCEMISPVETEAPRSACHLVRPAAKVLTSTSFCGALNSAVECHLHTVEVIGSNPIAPTIFHINALPVRGPSSRSGCRLQAPLRMFSQPALSNRTAVSRRTGLQSASNRIL